MPKARIKRIGGEEIYKKYNTKRVQNLRNKTEKDSKYLKKAVTHRVIKRKIRP